MRIVVESEEFAVLSFSVGPVTLPDSLTEAERAVARALLAGKSHAQIAKVRGTSIRTVINQVVAVMQKLSVHSRAEAVALLSRGASTHA